MQKLFTGKKVTIMGLGLHGGGLGAARFFCAQGAKVLITDLKTKDQLQESLKKIKGFDIEFRLGGHDVADFIKTDLVIKNPAVPAGSPYLKIARENNVEVDTDMNLFFKLCNVPIIGVTGTKGKSTVATLAYEMIKTKYRDSILAGNIGVSPLEILSKISSDSKVVLELSSFGLDDLTKSPNVAVVTNIYPDHLDRYASMEEYIESKKLIFKYQTKNDILILNYDDEQVRRFGDIAPSTTYFFSRDKKVNGCYCQGKSIFFNNEFVCNIEDLNIQGEHNVSNILCSILVAKLLDVPNKKIEKVIRSFKGVPHRQELIATKKGVKYINDTAATMPEAVIQALRTFGRVILIAGGQNKGLDYNELVGEIKGHVKTLILLPGTASEKIKNGLSGTGLKIVEVSTMEEAVMKGSKLAVKNDVVLLSPGAASFNLFQNEFDRGEQFVKYVKKIR
ncbi:MAG: UDP-N-acetylmuramoyl-L-alanine--D-glutamate ligase [Candidatus Staskawiczbacteria bacterium]|jgi:UDP-N-acetylmuramoylalanine--D-glutamate ligase